MRLVALLGAWIVAAAAILCLAGPGLVADVRVAAQDEIEEVLWRRPTTPTLAHLTPPPTALFAAARDKR